MQLKIATVLKCGGEYVERHVHALRDQCKKHIPWADFVCLSDGHLECKTIPLVDDFPGWWSKMELFKLDGPTKMTTHTSKISPTILYRLRRIFGLENTHKKKRQLSIFMADQDLGNNNNNLHGLKQNGIPRPF